MDLSPINLDSLSPSKVLRLVKELVDLRHPDTRICVSNRPEVDILTVLEPLASHAVSLHN